MATQQAKRPDNRARRHALNMKTTAELRQKLEDRAKQSGRVLTHEVEQQLIKSFDMEADLAMQDEIKAEMRGTIAALEARIALAQEWQNQLWPDESSRVLGKAFAMALGAARHATGKDWREDRSAALVVAGVVRRTMDRYTRGGTSIVADLFDGAQVAAMADSIVETTAAHFDKLMPPLSEPALDAAQWTGRMYLVTEFREAGTDRVLEIITGPEFDAANPEGRPARGDGYRAALARFASIRDTVDAEDFEVFVMRDGTHKRVSLDLTLGRPEPQTEEPATRLVGAEETATLMAGTKPARGQDAGIFDEALFAETMGPERPDDDTPPPAPAEPLAAPKPRARAKTPA